MAHPEISAVPTGLALLGLVPSAEALGYWQMSLRDITRTYYICVRRTVCDE